MMYHNAASPFLSEKPPILSIPLLLLLFGHINRHISMHSPHILLL